MALFAFLFKYCPDTLLKKRTIVIITSRFKTKEHILINILYCYIQIGAKIMSTKIYASNSNIFFRFLTNFSRKIKISSLKTTIDYIFYLAETISLKLEKLLPLYVKYYEDLVENEIQIAKISSLTQVAHIGCGPIPSTSILIAKKTGANVVAIDKNQQAMKKASLCVNKLKLTDKITIKNAEASTFPIENFDVLIISHAVKPKEKFLYHVSKTMKENAIIVYRSFSSESGELTDNDSFLKDIFIIDKISSSKRHGSVISIALLKKK